MKNPQAGNIPTSIVTRDMDKITAVTGNVYESLAIISKRSRQVAVRQKEEINNRLSEFSTGVDNLEEVHENREQIEISSGFERMPKPTAIAIDEFMEGKVFYRQPEEEETDSIPENL